MVSHEVTQFSAQIHHALSTDQGIDIATIGRKSGQPPCIEIWFHNFADHCPLAE